MALVSKILESTLTAGATTVTFTDSDLPNSLIRVFSTNANIYPSQISLSGTTLTVRYEEQSTSIGVAVEMIKSGLTVYDDLDSTSSEYALSAAQGKALNDDIGSLASSTSEAFSDAYDYIGSMEISDLSDVDFDSPSQGQVLGFDEDLGITNLPAPSAMDNYSTTEHVVGTWVDDSPVYEKTFNFGALPNATTKTLAHNITNLNYVISANGFTINTGTGNRFPVPFVNDSNINSQIVLMINNTNITIRTGVDRSDHDVCYITVRYTKSST